MNNISCICSRRLLTSPEVDLLVILSLDSAQCWDLSSWCQRMTCGHQCGGEVWCWRWNPGSPSMLHMVSLTDADNIMIRCLSDKNMILPCFVCWRCGSCCCGQQSETSGHDSKYCLPLLWWWCWSQDSLCQSCHWNIISPSLNQNYLTSLTCPALICLSLH